MNDRLQIDSQSSGRGSVRRPPLAKHQADSAKGVKQLSSKAPFSESKSTNNLVTQRPDLFFFLYLLLKPVVIRGASFSEPKAFQLYGIYVLLPYTEFESNRSIGTSSYLRQVNLDAKFFKSINQKLCITNFFFFKYFGYLNYAPQRSYKSNLNPIEALERVATFEGYTWRRNFSKSC